MNEVCFQATRTCSGSANLPREMFVSLVFDHQHAFSLVWHERGDGTTSTYGLWRRYGVGGVMRFPSSRYWDSPWQFIRVV